MMKGLKCIFFSLFLLVASLAFSQTGDAGKTTANSEQRSKDTTVHVAQRDGQKVFEQNCSRCHTTPQGFSPNISGTVVRHMRVRAGLSKEDEQAVLRFLNP
jgi:mono/diheme cytochrome c family protein